MQTVQQPTTPRDDITFHYDLSSTSELPLQPPLSSDRGTVIANISVLLSLGPLTVESATTSPRDSTAVGTPTTSAAVLNKVCSSLGVSPEHTELFEVKGSNSGGSNSNTGGNSGRNNSGRRSSETSDGLPHFAVQLKSDKMTVEYFKFLMIENKRLETKVDKAAEALLTFQQTLRKLTVAKPPAATCVTPPPAVLSPSANVSSSSVATGPTTIVASTATLTTVPRGLSGGSATTPSRGYSGMGGTSPRVPALPATGGEGSSSGMTPSSTSGVTPTTAAAAFGGGQRSPRLACSASVSSMPSSLMLAQQVKKLEATNESLQAELEELRVKIHRSEAFKQEVLQTVKELKKQLAVLTEELMFSDRGGGVGGGGMEGVNSSADSSLQMSSPSTQEHR